MYGLGDAMYEERQNTNALESLIRLFTVEELFERAKASTNDPEKMIVLIQAINYVHSN